MSQPTPIRDQCICGNMARCRACKDAIKAAVAREAQPPAQRGTRIGSLIRR